MAWSTGTATDFKNLLDIIQSTAEDNGWTVHNYVTGASGPRKDSVFLEGPGYGDGYHAFIGIRSYEDSGAGFYGLETRGYTDYGPDLNWDTQPGASPNIVVTRLWNAEIGYWISVSDRRIVVIAKVSNTYHSLYAGFFNPFASPVEYPAPMYIAGDASTQGAFGDTQGAVRSIAFPGNGGAYLREPGGVWRTVCVYLGDNNYQGMDNAKYTCWPYLPPGAPSTFELSGDACYPPMWQFESLPGISNSLWMSNIYLCGAIDDLGIIGALEGVFFIPGNLMATEQQLTVDSDTYRAFISISRSIEQPDQYYAVQEA